MNVKKTVLLLILYLAGALAYLGARHIAAVLVPRDLPALSNEELVDMTWRAFVANDGLERWRNTYRRVAEDGTVRSSLSDVKLDEIRRVGDKAFVAWRLVESPPAEDGSFLRHVYWVDVRSRKIVIDGEEINEY